MSYSDCDILDMEAEELESEYSLEDAFETLKDTEEARREFIEKVKSACLNTGSVATSKIGDGDEVRRKQHKLTHGLIKCIRSLKLSDHPIPGTSELDLEVLTEMKEEIGMMQRYEEKLEKRLSDINSDISYLEEKLEGLVKIKEAGIKAAKWKAKTNYEDVTMEAKRLFKAVRADLHTVVETVFQLDDDCMDFLVKLLSQYTKGGNDLYVDFTPEVIDFIHFLIEADIIIYNEDKTKVRLMDLL